MIDFVSLCRDVRISIAEEGDTHCTAGWVQTHCPFCGDGSYGFHLGFNLEFGNMNCWKCGKQDMKAFLKSILPASRHSQIFALIKKHTTKGHRVIRTKKTIVRKRNIKPVRGMGELLDKHKRYLERRGFDAEALIKEWGLKATRYLSGEWNWRIVAPIRDQEKRIVAYTGRALNKKEQLRWRTTPNDEMAVDPNCLIYGIEKCDPAAGILIVEGPSDVWRMGPGCGGLLGIDWSEQQASMLRQFNRRFICFDRHPVAQKRAKALAYWLAPFPGVTELILIDADDPGCLSQEEADNIMRELGLRE